MTSTDDQTPRYSGTDYRGDALDTYALARWYGHRAPRTFTDDAGHRWASRPDDLGRLVWTRPDGLGGQYAIDGHGAGRMRWTVQHRPAGVTWADAERWSAVGWSGMVDTRGEAAAWAEDHQTSGGPSRGADAAISYGLAPSNPTTEAAAAQNVAAHTEPTPCTHDDIRGDGWTGSDGAWCAQCGADLPQGWTAAVAERGARITAEHRAGAALPLDQAGPLAGWEAALMEHAPTEPTADPITADTLAAIDAARSSHPGSDDPAILTALRVEADALGMTVDQVHAVDTCPVVWACIDCTLYLVNDDDPTDAEPGWHDRFAEGLNDLGGSLMPFDFDDTDPSNDAAVAHWGSGRRDFDWSPCGVCGSRLGGSRHRFSIDR